jgi:WD40 repeat protein
VHRDISPDNQWLVTGSWDKTARLWDLRAKDPSASPVVLRGHEYAVCAVAISPDNRWIVTGSSDKTARLSRLERASISGEVGCMIWMHDAGCWSME